jgi:hypothetical protein
MLLVRQLDGLAAASLRTYKSQGERPYYEIFALASADR